MDAVHRRCPRGASDDSSPARSGVLDVRLEVRWEIRNAAAASRRAISDVTKGQTYEGAGERAMIIFFMKFMALCAPMYALVDARDFEGFKIWFPLPIRALRSP